MLTLRQLISPRDLIQRCLISMTKGELFRDQWLCVEIIYWHLGDRMNYITGTYARHFRGSCRRGRGPQSWLFEV